MSIDIRRESAVLMLAHAAYADSRALRHKAPHRKAYLPSPHHLKHVPSALCLLGGDLHSRNHLARERNSTASAMMLSFFCARPHAYMPARPGPIHEKGRKRGR